MADEQSTENGEPRNYARDLLIGIEQLGEPSREILIYVAGPYGDALRCNRKINIARAEFVGVALCHLGFTPIIPHKLFEGWEAYGWAPRDFYAMDLHILNRCQAICMVVGWQLSKGSQIEFKYAEDQQIPVIYEAEVSLADGNENDSTERPEDTEDETSEGVSLDPGAGDLTSENRRDDT
jgi:hypothetical protein